MRPLGGFVVLASAVMTLVAAQQTPGFVAAMELLTRVGNKEPGWVVAGLTAIAYALLAPRRRWAGLVVVGAVVVLQHYQQVALAELVHRGHPPDSGGTFPSGGAARAVAVYGTCALVLLRVTSAGRRAVAVTGAAVTAVAFFEGWSRLSLNAHWATDVLAGWLSGGLCSRASRTPPGPCSAPAAVPLRSRSRADRALTVIAGYGPLDVLVRPVSCR